MIANIRNEIRWFFQRGRKGYCDKDIWEIDSWFATTFPRMLTEFSEKTHDYPPGFGDPDDVTLSKKGLISHTVAEGDEIGYLAWKTAIKEAADLFSATGGHCMKTPSAEAQKSRDKAFEFIRKYFYDLWC